MIWILTEKSSEKWFQKRFVQVDKWFSFWKDYLQSLSQKICWLQKFKKIQILINKPVYFGLSILELNKTVTYEFWYDNVEQKNSEKEKLHYMDIDSSIVYIKTNGGIAENVQTRFDTSY